MDATPRVAVSDIVRRVCVCVQQDLEALPLKSKLLDDGARRRAALQFLKQARHKLIKLLVLLKWACEQSALVDDAMALTQDLSTNEHRIFDAVNALRGATAVLNTARAPLYDIGSAVDVLSTGTYLRLPKAIARISGNEDLDNRLPEMDSAETLRKLEQYILERLLRTSTPRQFSSFRVTEGTLVCIVEGEFEVDLTLSGAVTDSPWVVLRLKLFVAGEEHTCEGGVEAFHNDDPNQLDDDDVPGGMDTKDRNCKRKRAKDASSAFRPKRKSVLYLLRVLQQRLLKSEDALNDVFEVLHTFCATLCLKMLEAQAKELAENHWKMGGLGITSASRKLELRHWSSSCTVKIQFDTKHHGGQLFIKLEPAVDAFACRAAVMASLNSRHGFRMHRKVVVDRDHKDDGENDVEMVRKSDEDEEGSFFVEGLNPTALNVEKVLLLSAIAQTESRLTHIGLAIDKLLFSIENSETQSVQISPWVISSFRHTSVLSSMESRAVLNCTLPASRALRISVEMRTGALLLDFARHSEEAAGNLISFSPRKWGSSSDVLLLSDAEKTLNKMTLKKGMDGEIDTASIAKALVQNLFVFSLHAVVECIECICEEWEVDTTRTNPFLIDPTGFPSPASQRGDRRITYPPCLFIKLEQGGGSQFFVCCGGRGTFERLFPAIDRSALAPMPNSASTMRHLEWFIVCGPDASAGPVQLSRRVLICTEEIKFENVTENYEHEQALRQMLEQATARAKESLTAFKVQRVAHVFKNHVTWNGSLSFTASLKGSLTDFAFDHNNYLSFFFTDKSLDMAVVGGAAVEPHIPRGQLPPQLNDLRNPYLSRTDVPNQAPMRVRLEYPAHCKFHGRIFEDLLCAARMEVLMRTLFRMEASSKDRALRLDQYAQNELAYLVYAGHDVAVLKCKNGVHEVDVAVTISSKTKKFQIILCDTMKQLPWKAHIEDLLNANIPNDEGAVIHSIESVHLIARQLIASLVYGIPLIPVLDKFFSPKEHQFLGNAASAHSSSGRLSTPGTGGSASGRGSGKVGLSQHIQTMKSAVDKGAKSISLVPLSHLKFRLALGEVHQIDFTMLPKSVELITATNLEGIQNGAIIPHADFEKIITRCLNTVFK